jgi:hypothetical protein
MHGCDSSSAVGRLVNARSSGLCDAHLEPCACEKLNPDVLVMQPAKQGVRHDAPDLLDRARD